MLDFKTWLEMTGAEAPKVSKKNPKLMVQSVGGLYMKEISNAVYKKKRKFFKAIIKSFIQKQQYEKIEKANKEAIQKEIEQMAYFKWLDAGRPDNCGDQFWKAAEEEYQEQRDYEGYYSNWPNPHD
jgi:hypothetical protein